MKSTRLKEVFGKTRSRQFKISRIYIWEMLKIYSLHIFYTPISYMEWNLLYIDPPHMREWVCNECVGSVIYTCWNPERLQWIIAFKRGNGIGQKPQGFLYLSYPTRVHNVSSMFLAGFDVFLCYVQFKLII
jgi:hypothetical protein